MGLFRIEQDQDWEGDADDLVNKAESWARVFSIEDASNLSSRLVRDYVQRGIVARPRREGKVALYGWEHLVQLLAARTLLNDGWPLQKISDLFVVSSLDEVRALLPDPEGRSSQPVSSSPVAMRRSEPRFSAASQTRDLFAEDPQHIDAPASSPKAMSEMMDLPRIAQERLRRSAASQRQLEHSLDVLGGSAKRIRRRQMTRIEIAPGVELNIDTTRLKRLGTDDAEAIAQAVAAFLTDPRLRDDSTRS